QIRIVFRNREQATEYAGKLILRGGIFLERRRIGDRRRVDLHLRRARARLGDGGQHGFLLRRVALHGRDEVGGQISPALILRLHVGPFGLGGFFLGRDRVDPAPCQRHRQHQGKQGHAQASATRSSFHGNPPNSVPSAE